MLCVCWHRGEAELWLQPIRNPTLEGGDRSAPRSSRITPAKDSVVIAHAAGWSSGSVWIAREISPPPGFEFHYPS